MTNVYYLSHNSSSILLWTGVEAVLIIYQCCVGTLTIKSHVIMGARRHEHGCYTVLPISPRWTSYIVPKGGWKCCEVRFVLQILSKVSVDEVQGGPKKPDHFLKCITFLYNDIGTRSIYQNVQLYIRSKYIGVATGGALGARAPPGLRKKFSGPNLQGKVVSAPQTESAPSEAEQ